MKYSTLSIEESGSVAEITLTRPDLLNRIDAAAHAELTSAFRDVATRGNIRAVVFASTGPVFSAGGDFELILQANRQLSGRLAVVEQARQLLGSLLDLPQPIVVALHGDAIGLGATLVLMCDAVVAYRGCGLADPHVKMGLVAGDGGCFAWPASAGMVRARRHLLTGDPISAEAAYSCGLVSDLVDEPQAALTAARAIALKSAALPPLAVQQTKRVLNHLSRLRLQEVLELGTAAEVLTLGTKDCAEAVAAFKEKRVGAFLGE